MSGTVVHLRGPRGETFSFVLQSGVLQSGVPGMLPGWSIMPGLATTLPSKDTESIVTPEEALIEAQVALRKSIIAARANVDRSDREMSLMWSGIAEVWTKIAEVRYMTTPLVKVANTQEPRCDTCQDNGCGECQVDPTDRGDWPFNLDPSADAE